MHFFQPAVINYQARRVPQGSSPSAETDELAASGGAENGMGNFQFLGDGPGPIVGAPTRVGEIVTAGNRIAYAAYCTIVPFSAQSVTFTSP